MNKKLLTAAIGAALVAVPMFAANADVKVGGHAQVEYYNGDTECNTLTAPGLTGTPVCTGGTGSVTRDGSGLVDNARGRFWIAADEDLGGGMKGLAHFEFSVDTANSGSASMSGDAVDGTARTFDQRTRQKWVGLQGGFGTLKFGNQHGAYKLAGGVAWDPLNATVLEARGNGAQSGSGDAIAGAASFAHNGFIPGAITYTTPKSLPVEIQLLYAPSENKTSAGEVTANVAAGNNRGVGDGDDMQLSAKWKAGWLELMAAFSQNEVFNANPGTTKADFDATKFGARATFGPHAVWLQSENMDTGKTSVGDAADVERDYVWLGYSVKFGNNTFVAQWGESDDDAANKFEAEYRSLGLIHNMSKTFRIFGGWRETESSVANNVGNRETTIFSVGMRKDF